MKPISRREFLKSASTGVLASAASAAASRVAQAQGASAGGSRVSPSELVAIPKGGGARQGSGAGLVPDLFTGTGNFGIPSDVAPGANGLAPTVRHQYSS